MKKYFEVTVKTQLGSRNGTLLLDIQQGEIEGNFSFLKKTMPICGTLGNDGKCELSGTFITPLKTHSYHAEGSLNGSDIQLILYDGKHCYEVFGKEVNHELY